MPERRRFRDKINLFAPRILRPSSSPDPHLRNSGSITPAPTVIDSSRQSHGPTSCSTPSKDPKFKSADLQTNDIENPMQSLVTVDEPMVDSGSSARSPPIQAVQSFSGTYNEVYGPQYNIYGATSVNISGSTSHQPPRCTPALTKDERKLLNTLNRVVDAPYNSAAREFATGCLPGTRIDILQKIHHWVNLQDTSVFWLNGAAGTGKSTIAHSVAMAYDTQGTRAASFFFSRDQQARRETRFVFQSIAFQLGTAYPALGAEIANVLEDQTILTSTLQHQYRQLILQPISAVKNLFPLPVVVVLDALDECKEEDAVSRILKLLLEEVGSGSLPLKFFITSRPERHIRSTFHSSTDNSKTHGLVLHEIALSDVERDVWKYIEHQLKEIRKGCELLDDDHWPSEQDIRALVTIAAGLFISAATAVRFIRPIKWSPDPRDRLKLILQPPQQSPDLDPTHPFRYLDFMYTQILTQATGEAMPSSIFDQLRTIIGAVVLAYGRLSVDELGELLRMKGRVRPMLEELHSVILVPKGQGPIRALHASFHDYITDQRRCADTRFFINPPVHHAAMARFCLERMKHPSLKRDICEICDSSRLNSEVDDLNLRIARFLPGDLQYAARYWAFHLCESRHPPDEVLVQLIETFAFTSLLHWIELLSLIGQLGDGLKCLREAQAVLSAVIGSPRQLLELLHDAERFLFDFYDVIAISALHIYNSALPFTPKGTVLYRNFSREHSPKVLHSGSNDWDACLRTIDHPHPVLSVALSNDGTRIASGSSIGTVYIWDTSTGAPAHQLKGQQYEVRSVAFSSDGTQVISAHDTTICIWDASNGVFLRSLNGHTYSVNSVAMSSCGTRIISGSDDYTVRIWDARTGAALHILEGHSDDVNSISISQNGTCVSGSHDKIIFIWNSQTGTELGQFKGHEDPVESVAISNDSTRVVSASLGGDVLIWDTWSGVVLQCIAWQQAQTPVAISYDGTCIVSRSYSRGSLMIWDAETGAELRRLEGHSDSILSVAIGKDSTRAISASGDKTIRIWDIQASPSSTTSQINGHTSPVMLVTISHDRTRIISICKQRAITWDGETGSILHQFEIDGYCHLLAVSHDCVYIVGSSWKHRSTIRIWDSRRAVLLHELSEDSGEVTSTAISHDCTRIISGSDDNTVRIWDTHHGVALRCWTWENAEKDNCQWHRVAISDNGTLAVSYTLQVLRILDVDSGAKLHHIKTLLDTTTLLLFSHDSTRLVVYFYGYETFIRVWDTQTGELLCQMDAKRASHYARMHLSPHETHVIYDHLSLSIPHHARPLSGPPEADEPQWFELHDDGWLTTEHGHKRICWVPLAYRREVALSYPLKLAVFGTMLGQIFIIKFPTLDS